MNAEVKATLGFAALAAILFVAALGFGAYPMGPVGAVAALFGAGGDEAVAIAREIRFPRALLGALVGGALGAAGAGLQGYFRNPLADPGIVGVTSSASLGAVIALYFGLGFDIVPLAAMAGGALGVIALFAVAGRGASALTLILAGVAVAAFANALTALALNMAPNPWALSEIAYWLMGSLRDANARDMMITGPLIIAGIAVLLTQRGALDALSLGEDAAASLGVNVPHTRLIVVIGATLAVGASVAAAGAIGFIGLVAPHLARPFVGHAPGKAILPAAFLGAALLNAADIGVRALSGFGTPIYLGVLTALVGAPFFFWLIRSNRARTA